MDLSTLLRSPAEQVHQTLTKNGELSATVSEDAEVIVRRTEDGGYLGDLRVKGATVVLVREVEIDRFRQRLKEQIAIHVSRDQQPDLTEP